MPASLHWLIKWAQTNLALAFGEMNLAFLCQCYKYPDKNLFELKWNYGLNLLLLILKRNKSFSLICMTHASDNTHFRESKRIYPELKMGFTLWEVQQSTTACYKKASEKNRFVSLPGIYILTLGGFLGISEESSEERRVVSTGRLETPWLHSCGCDFLHLPAELL